MLRIRVPACIVAGLVSVFSTLSQGAVVTEDFRADPLTRGWTAFGNSDLFHWNATDQALEVTWDSSQPNSYFYQPLGTVLGKDDDFGLEFDLRLNDIASGSVPGKTGPFEIAIGFWNLAQATATNFFRGTGADSPNLVEFDYFPAGVYADWGPVDATVSPTLISSNHEFASGFNLIELSTNALYHVTLRYSAADQVLRTTITSNGSPFQAVNDVVLGTNFTDFRVDTVAINSYSDTGDPFDSVQAHGSVDNLVVTLPPLPVRNLFGTLVGNVWQAQFVSLAPWVYTLERTEDFQAWTPVTAAVKGSGDSLILQDTNAPPASAFYRVRAQRP